MENNSNSPNGYGKYIDEKLNEAAKHYFADSTDEEKYSLADVIMIDGRQPIYDYIWILE